MKNPLKVKNPKTFSDLSQTRFQTTYNLLNDLKHRGRSEEEKSEIDLILKHFNQIEFLKLKFSINIFPTANQYW